MPWLKSLILKHYSYSVLSFSRRTFYRTMHALAVEFICQLFIENALRRPDCSFQAVFSGQKRTEKELSYQLDFPKTFIELLRFFVIVLLCAKQRLNKVIFGLSFCLHFWKLGKAYTTDKFALDWSPVERQIQDFHLIKINFNIIISHYVCYCSGTWAEIFLDMLGFKVRYHLYMEISYQVQPLSWQAF